MKIGVSLKMLVTAIDKARLFQGKKGHYLDATVFIDIGEMDQYGNNGMITQDVSKEEKQQGVKGNILGNCKVFWNDSGQQAPQQQAQQSGGFQAQQQQPAQQNGFQQQAPKQSSGFSGQATQQTQQQYVQGNQQQAPKVNPQEPTIDFDDDIPF